MYKHASYRGPGRDRAVQRVLRYCLLRIEMVSAALNSSAPFLAPRSWFRVAAHSTALACLLSCGGSSVGPEIPGDTTNCHLPAISLPTTATPACTPISAGCPRTRPADAKTLIAVSSCSIAENESGCTPILNPICPTSNITFASTLVNPNVGVSDPCAANLHVQATATPSGGAEIDWEAQELRRSGPGCESSGAPLSGHARVTGPCCEASVDIRFPNLKFTHRLVFRSDWQQ
jgi:hypothetical protein